MLKNYFQMAFGFEDFRSTRPIRAFSLPTEGRETARILGFLIFSVRVFNLVLMKNISITESSLEPLRL